MLSRLSGTTPGQSIELDTILDDLVQRVKSRRDIIRDITGFINTVIPLIPADLVFSRSLDSIHTEIEEVEAKRKPLAKDLSTGVVEDPERRLHEYVSFVRNKIHTGTRLKFSHEYHFGMKSPVI